MIADVPASKTRGSGWLVVGGTPTGMGAGLRTATTVAVPATAKRGAAVAASEKARLGLVGWRCPRVELAARWRLVGGARE